MRIASPSFTFPAALLIAAFFTSTTAAQAPADPPPGAPTEHHHHPPVPEPTNLQALPKTMNGEQVHELMHQWEAALGTDCGHCHAVDPTKKMPNGRPALNYADDSKPEKAAARLMYRMVDAINTQYVGKIDNSGLPVSCGTCHRGHVSPPPFVAPAGHEHHEGTPEHHEHDAPPAGARPGSGR